MSPKWTPLDAFDEIQKVALYGISDNMPSIAQSGKYGAINTNDTATNTFYVIVFTSEAYTLQYYTKIYR